MFEKLVGHAKEFAALVVPASLLVGVCWLTGACWALGMNAFGFVTVADVVRSALLAAPALVVCTAGILVAQQAFPVLDRSRNRKPDTSLSFQHRVFRLDVIVSCLTFGVGYMFLTPGVFYTLLIWWGVILYGTTSDYTFALGRESGLSPIIPVLTMVVGVCVAITMLSLSTTGGDIVKAGKTASETICVREVCKDGTVIKRFSDATYVRWANDNYLAIVPNSEITSITGKKALTNDPIIDVRPYLSRFWSWATSDATP